jgi:hypothetical protein
LNLELIFKLFSSLSFILFGIACFYSKYFKSEFIRYGLSNYRSTTGFFQLLGGIGTLIGFFFNKLILISSAGLSILMLLGVIVRLKINDGLIKTSPAIIYMLINIYIFFSSLK